MFYGNSGDYYSDGNNQIMSLDCDILRGGMKMSKKEKQAMNHLAKTCMLVSSLNNDDIKMMLNVKQKEKEVKQKQREN